MPRLLCTVLYMMPIFLYSYKLYLIDTDIGYSAVSLQYYFDLLNTHPKITTEPILLKAQNEIWQPLSSKYSCNKIR